MLRSLQRACLSQVKSRRSDQNAAATDGPISPPTKATRTALLPETTTLPSAMRVRKRCETEEDAAATALVRRQRADDSVTGPDENVLRPASHDAVPRTGDDVAEGLARADDVVEAEAEAGVQVEAEAEARMEAAADAESGAETNQLQVDTEQAPAAQGTRAEQAAVLEDHAEMLQPPKGTTTAGLHDDGCGVVVTEAATDGGDELNAAAALNTVSVVEAGSTVEADATPSVVCTDPPPQVPAASRGFDGAVARALLALSGGAL